MRAVTHQAINNPLRGRRLRPHRGLVADCGGKRAGPGRGGAPRGAPLGGLGDACCPIPSSHAPPLISQRRRLNWSVI